MTHGRARCIAAARSGLPARAAIHRLAEQRVRSAREVPNEELRRNAVLPGEAWAQPVAAGTLVVAAAGALAVEADFVAVAIAVVAAIGAVALIAHRHCAVDCYQGD